MVAIPTRAHAPGAGTAAYPKYKLVVETAYAVLSGLRNRPVVVTSPRPQTNYP